MGGETPSSARVLARFARVFRAGASRFFLPEASRAPSGVAAGGAADLYAVSGTHFSRGTTGATCAMGSAAATASREVFTLSNPLFAAALGSGSSTRAGLPSSSRGRSATAENFSLAAASIGAGGRVLPRRVIFRRGLERSNLLLKGVVLSSPRGDHHSGRASAALVGGASPRALAFAATKASYVKSSGRAVGSGSWDSGTTSSSSPSSFATIFRLAAYLAEARVVRRAGTGESDFLSALADLD